MVPTRFSENDLLPHNQRNDPATISWNNVSLFPADTQVEKDITEPSVELLSIQSGYPRDPKDIDAIIIQYDNRIENAFVSVRETINSGKLFLV